MSTHTVHAAEPFDAPAVTISLSAREAIAVGTALAEFLGQRATMIAEAPHDPQVSSIAADMGQIGSFLGRLDEATR